MSRKIKLLIPGAAAAVFAAALASGPARMTVLAQQPTGSIPTVTGTPAGPVATVYLDLEQVEVWAGPSQYSYPAIGILLSGQQVPALGRSADGEWIQVRYPGVPGSVGWVYGPYVSLSRGSNLPTVQTPPTPTIVATQTINPTLVAAFIVAETPTRLPTFTPATPLALPTFVDETAHPSRIPAGLVIASFGLIGLIGALISFLRGR
jgi:hypothetical protein